MRRRVGGSGLLATLMLAALAGEPARAAVVEAPWKITEVTVLRDRAEVVRSAEVVLPAGAAAVVFRGLPYSTGAGSMRVRSGAGARIGAVEEEWRVEPASAEEEARLRAEALRLEDALAEITAGRAIDGSLRKYFEGVLESSARVQGPRVLEGGGDPGVIQEIYVMARRELTELARRDLEQRPRLRGLETEKSEVEERLEELEEITETGGSRHLDVRVELEVDRAGPLHLELRHEVRGASWMPAYRAELGPGGESVQLVLEAVVSQKTAEDWEDVELHLSSASPAGGLEPPRIETSWLAVALPKATAPDHAADSDGVSGFNPNSIEEMEVIAGAGASFGRAQGGFANIVAAGPSFSSSYTVTFSVPGRVRLAADGQARRVMLRSEELKARPIYRVVPSKDPRAFLVLHTLAPLDYPLLAGAVRAYSGAVYLGGARIPETAPGGKLTLPFGAEPRIEVTHVPSGQEGREGWSGKQRLLSQTTRTLIQNLHERKITLIVEGQIPVSKDERIEVELTGEATRGYTPSGHRPGVMLWELELEPGEKREVVLDYTVRHPSDVTLLASR